MDLGKSTGTSRATGASFCGVWLACSGARAGERGSVTESGADSGLDIGDAWVGRSVLIGGTDAVGIAACTGMRVGLDGDPGTRLIVAVACVGNTISSEDIGVGTSRINVGSAIGIKSVVSVDGVRGVGVGVALNSNGGSNDVAGIGSTVDINSGGVGASGSSPPMGPVVVEENDCWSAPSGVAVGDDWNGSCDDAATGVRVKRSSTDGRVIDVGEGASIAGPRVVNGVGSILAGVSELDTDAGSKVAVGVRSNGVVAGVGVGVALPSNEGSSVLACIVSIVGANGGRVGGSGRCPSMGPAVVIAIVCCSGPNGVAVGDDWNGP